MLKNLCKALPIAAALLATPATAENIDPETYLVHSFLADRLCGKEINSYAVFIALSAYMEINQITRQQAAERVADMVVDRMSLILTQDFRDEYCSFYD